MEDAREEALAEGIKRGRKEREAELESALAEGIERGRKESEAEFENFRTEAEQIIINLRQEIESLKRQLTPKVQ